jgi:ATP/maltotriose-dependent transcriptional regulator MalT
VATTIRFATRAGLVDGDGERLRFRHDLIREVIYGEMLSAERRDLHRAAAQSLARTGASVQRIARQFELGAVEGDLEAVDWLVRAADDVVSISPSAGTELYESALALAPGSWAGRSRVEAALLEPLAWCGRIERAEEVARSALAVAQEPSVAFAIQQGVAAIFGHRGDTAGAIEHMRRASEVAGAPERELRRMRCLTAQLEALTGVISSDQARRRASAELRVARETGDATTQCVALQVLGAVESLEGRYGVAEGALRESMALHESGHVQSTSYLIPDLFHAGALLYLDRTDDARRATDRSRRTYLERGALSQLPMSFVIGAATRFYTGDWDDADAEITAGLAVAEDTGSRNFVLFFHSMLARLAIGRGSLDEATQHIDRGVAELAEGSLFGADWLLFVHSELQYASGEHADALATALIPWDQAAHLRLFYGYRDHCMLLVRLAIANDLTDVRDDAVACLHEGADRAPSAGARARAVHARGLVESDAHALHEALVLYRRTPFRPLVGRCCEDLAAQLAYDGDQRASAPLFDEAAQIAVEIGAAGDVARIEAASRRIGLARPARAARPTFGWESLTPMELTVSDLVAEGLTNPEIGEELHISRRTVESHVSHVLRKLDVSSRTKLAAEVVRRAAQTPRTENP